jgi:hypothetical protein
MNARDTYFDALEDKLGLGRKWHANWLPGSAIEVGMVGSLDDGQFTHTANLKARGIDLEAEKDQQSGGDLSYASSGSVEFQAGVQGESEIDFAGLADGEAGVKVSFSRENAVAVSFLGTRGEGARDERKLAEDIVAAFRKDRSFEVGECVVCRVLHADSGFALVSAGSTAEVAMKANVKIGKGPIDIGSVKGALDLKSQSEMSFAATMPAGAIAAYRVLRLDDVGIFVLTPKVRAALVAEPPDYLATF